MSRFLEEALVWSRARSSRHWHYIADNCPFPGLAGSRLDSTEGDPRWGTAGVELDHFGVDALAWHYVSGFTPVALRVHDHTRHPYRHLTIRYRTADGYRSEWHRLRNATSPVEPLWLVQMYVAGYTLHLALVVNVADLRGYLARQYAHAEPYRLRNSHDGAEFVRLYPQALERHDVRCWVGDPTKATQLTLDTRSTT